ncbi:kinase-like domain-containing protein [Rhizophagus irregularis DAOM 181602=DAOM 197198]|nr:kinase-like domain-containing protein [Rhizophagus irregularis DAOM 181602=DAOM 197198]
METLLPTMTIEWIPYNKIKNIKFLTKGGYSEVYTAVWIDGTYDDWDSKKQQLKSVGRHDVILKTLGNVESENQRWFEEAISHLTITFHSKSYDFEIPDNIEDFNKSSSRRTFKSSSKIFNIEKFQSMMSKLTKK